MKKLLVLPITICQEIFSGILKNILGVKNGIIKGSFISFARLVQCQPFINL